MRIPVRSLLLVVLCAGMFAAATPAPFSAPAPDVTYTTVTSYHFSGFLGRILARSLPDALYEDAYLSGDRLLTKNREENTGTLIDVASEQFVHIDYGKKTYAPISFEELKALYEQRLEEARQQQNDNAQNEGAPASEVTFDVSIDRTGEMIDYNGMACERVVMTLQAKGTTVDAETDEEVSGNLVIVTDALITSEVAGYQEMQAFNQKLAEKMGRVLTGGTSQDEALAAIAQALGSDDAGLKASLEKAQAELEGLEGMAVKTIMHMVSVPYGTDYNPDLLAESGQAAQEEAPKKRRGLGGLKKLVEEAAAGQTGQPAQKTIFSIESRVEDAQQATVPAGTLDVPADFKRVDFTM